MKLNKNTQICFRSMVVECNNTSSFQLLCKVNVIEVIFINCLVLVMESRFGIFVQFFPVLSHPLSGLLSLLKNMLESKTKKCCLYENLIFSYCI